MKKSSKPAATDEVEETEDEAEEQQQAPKRSSGPEVRVEPLIAAGENQQGCALVCPFIISINGKSRIVPIGVVLNDLSGDELMKALKVVRAKSREVADQIVDGTFGKTK